ncbi:MAG: hypothetical protein IJQ14_00265 [Bacteroidales bacterium]|nr:hypothetical protein [Bacteroidales bacterium]
MQVSDINTAIVNVVKDLGSDVLKSSTLVGILSDYRAFNVHDPLLAEKKSAISVLAASGYVDKLLKWKKQSGNLWQAEDAQWIEGLCKKQGLRRNIVGLIADAMKEAIGLEVTFTEFSDPKKMLSSEIRKYEAALKKQVTTYTDQLGIKGAFYSTSANTELYRLEGRIKILAQAANSHTYDDKWITAAKKKVIDGLSTVPSQRTQILNDTIASGVGEYKQIIDRQKEAGEKGLKMFGGAEVVRMKEIAERVNYAYRLLPRSTQLDVERDVRIAKDEVAKFLQQQKVLAELDNVKLEYQQLLKDSLVVETDCLGLVSAYYNTDKQGEIVVLEHKMSSYAKELGVPSDIEDWIKSEKKLLVDQNSTSSDKMHSTARKILAEDGIAYSESIKKLIVSGKKSKKAFDDTTEQISLAERINRAFEIIGDPQRVDVKKDVANAKTAVKKYRIYRFALITLISVIVGFLAVIFISDKVENNKHRSEINAFENSITEGDNMLANGNAIEALYIYINAEKEYTADYRTDHYKAIAQEKQNNASQIIFTKDSTKIDSLLYVGKCKDAKLQYDTLSSIGLTIDLSKYSQSFQESLQKSVEEQRDLILKDISNKKGKPSQQNCEEIDDLLYCMPDDYYLNLIKGKMK